MIISDIVSQIKPSAIFAVAAKASQMHSKGLDVLSLSLGEPDFDTPQNIKDAAVRAIMSGETRYTPVDGTVALKRAIQQKFKKDNGLSYELEQISVGSGAKQVIYNTLAALLNQGDEVIIPAPYWASYPEMVIFAGGKVVTVFCSAQSGFKLAPHELEAAITSKTKVLMLNSPSNPTGATYSKEELAALAAVLLKYPQICVISDDLYEHIVFDEFKFTTLADVAPELYDRIITVNGVSKAYAMTGWRIGYAGAPAHLVKAISKVQSQSTSNPCSISQAAAIEALLGDQSFVPERASIFQKRRDLVLKKLVEVEFLSCNKPEGAFYLFPSCSGYFGKKTPSGSIINSSLDFCNYLLDEGLVAVVPGSPFGAEGFFRISCAASEEVLLEACARIKKACDKLA